MAIGRPKRRWSYPIGTIIGRWTIVGPLEVRDRSSGYGISYQECVCDCGTRRSVQISAIKGGISQSCGCLNREKIVEKVTTHGGYKTRLYRTWHDMIRRCTNKKHRRYMTWGGRGVRVCDSWRDFAEFRRWALSSGYNDSLEIDRFDVNGNYEPDNCRWVDEPTQGQNRRNTTVVEAFGESKTLFRWSKDPRCVVAYTTLAARIRRGIPPEDAISRPAPSVP